MHARGNSSFRPQINERRRPSQVFRKLLLWLSLFWSIPGLVVDIGCTVTIFTTPVEIRFAIAWAAPFLRMTLWISLTSLSVLQGLKERKVMGREANFYSR